MKKAFTLSFLALFVSCESFAALDAGLAKVSGGLAQVQAKVVEIDQNQDGKIDTKELLLYLSGTLAVAGGGAVALKKKNGVTT